MKHRFTVINLFVQVLVAATALSLAAADPSKAGTAVMARDADQKKVQELRNELAQLQQELRELREQPTNRVADDRQQAYREKLEELRRRQEFENRYLGSGE